MPSPTPNASDSVSQTGSHLTPHAGPLLDRAAAARLDAAATTRCGIPGLLLMEHAAIGATALIERELAANGIRRVVVLCGPGNNGGDGWAIARLLRRRDVPVEVVELAPPEAPGDAATNRAIAIAFGIPVRPASDLYAPTVAQTLDDALVVDALFGTGLARPLAGPPAVLVDVVRGRPALVFAIDVPSGLDADTGSVLGTCLPADVTATMVAPKIGLLSPGSEELRGRIEIVDIGVPADLIEAFDVSGRNPPNRG
ncbi:MAG: NAD(P)H-hydrate epimerase [Phycisphaerae bacterium]|nr:NAD(P)H-hydrate epimerase [Phycisphaerae bacterium]